MGLLDVTWGFCIGFVSVLGVCCVFLRFSGGLCRFFWLFLVVCWCLGLLLVWLFVLLLSGVCWVVWVMVEAWVVLCLAFLWVFLGACSVLLFF